MLLDMNNGPFFTTPELQIFADDFTKSVGQHHAAVYSPLFFNPHGTARSVDIFNIQYGQRAGSKTQGAQQHDVGDAPWRDNEVSKSHGRASLVRKMADQSFVPVRLWRIRFQ